MEQLVNVLKKAAAAPRSAARSHETRAGSNYCQKYRTPENQPQGKRAVNSRAAAAGKGALCPDRHAELPLPGCRSR